MNQATIDLEGLEQRAYRTLWSDGLIDLCIGLYILATGILLSLDEAAFMGLVPLLIWPLWLRMRRSLIEPRAGVVRFGAERQARERKKRGALTVLLALTMVVGVGVYLFLAQGQLFGLLSAHQDERPRLLFGLMLAVVLSCAGLLYGVRRVHAYAGILVACLLFGASLGLSPAACMTSAGALVTLAGLALLARFVRATPLPETHSHVGS